MAKKKREQTTRRMPGGAQQYARPDSNSNRQSPIARRMDTIGAAMDDVRRTPRTLENAADRDAKQRMLLQAMIDESDTAQNARMMERQTTAEDRANRRKEGGAMKSKKSKAPTTSTRPTPNPRRSDPVSRGNAASRRQQSEQDDVLKNGGRGMKAGGKVKKMQAGGRAQTGAANRADRLRKDLEAREGRSARQEAEYQAAQQRRREAGGLSRLAMVPEAVRRAQVRLGDRLLASSEARENAPLRAKVAAADREVTDTLGRKAGGKVKKMAKGGKCRGMGAATRGGNFSRG
jgi:hypothetical protein